MCHVYQQAPTFSLTLCFGRVYFPLYSDREDKKRAKFPKAEARLHERYKQRRQRALPVSGHWLRSGMRKILREMLPNDPAAQKFVASRKWLKRFCTRWAISKRKKTNVKKLRFVRVFAA